jgi:hypothetical protein
MLLCSSLFKVNSNRNEITLQSTVRDPSNMVGDVSLRHRWPSGEIICIFLGY